MPIKRNILSDQQDITNLFDSLSYQRNDQWLPLPGWAKFFLKLGDCLSTFDHSNSRFTIALALPCRSYASLFVTCGIVCGRSRIKLGEDDHEYYEELLSLKKGTPLIYRDGIRKKKAIKRDNFYYEGKMHIGVQVDKGPKTTFYVRPDQVRSIEIVDRDATTLPNQQKGRKIPPPSILAKEVIGDSFVYDFILQTRLDCVVIGPMNILREENKIDLATTKTLHSESSGALSDLTRIRELQSPDSAYRSSVFPAGSKKCSSLNDATHPFAVVFDGPYGFTKWRDWYRQSNWIVILDRTGLNFSYGASLINQEYLSRSIKESKVRIPQLPPNTEAMIFTSEL